MKHVFFVSSKYWGKLKYKLQLLFKATYLLEEISVKIVTKTWTETMDREKQFWRYLTRRDMVLYTNNFTWSKKQTGSTLLRSWRVSKSAAVRKWINAIKYGPPHWTLRSTSICFQNPLLNLDLVCDKNILQSCLCIANTNSVSVL